MEGYCLMWKCAGVSLDQKPDILTKLILYSFNCDKEKMWIYFQLKSFFFKKLIFSWRLKNLAEVAVTIIIISHL